MGNNHEMHYSKSQDQGKDAYMCCSDFHDIWTPRKGDSECHDMGTNKEMWYTASCAETVLRVGGCWVTEIQETQDQQPMFWDICFCTNKWNSKMQSIIHIMCVLDCLSTTNLKPKRHCLLVVGFWVHKSKKRTKIQKANSPTPQTKVLRVSVLILVFELKPKN